jgi:uncharacterized protein (DUF2141 family)
VPENFTINFKGNEIRIYFNEYIKLKNLQKNLIISPPMDIPPTLYPLSTSKYIKIVFQDTLRKNTTYSINFGNSIVDNNEENPYEYYKYVFSTGSYIDSLKVLGTITDAQLLKPEEFVSVMLYEVNSDFSDSIIYTKKPLYVANTQNNPDSFQIENLKEGKYLLIALKDNNSNYTFQPKIDKIGFIENLITVPADTSYTLNLFKETPAYALTRPNAVNQNQIVFGYEGEATSLEFEILTPMPEDFRYHLTKVQKKDTLNYWFKPKIELDSVTFKVSNSVYVDTVQVRIRNLLLDSLKFSPIKAGILAFDEPFEISSNLPMISLNKEYIHIQDKDSINVVFEAHLDTYLNLLQLHFEKKERQNYFITLFPEAITEFFGGTNDTLHYKVSTRTPSDYGFLTLYLNHIASFPILVQLVTEKGEVSKEMYSTEKSTFEFANLTPGKYYIRIVYDTNANGKWDTGNFLKRIQPEVIIYYPKLIDIRANWTLNETFILD